MKVGDYVRTSRGIIKVSKIYERADGNVVFDDERGYQWYFSEIKETSPDIIDLIEVGDYVNGKQIIDIQMKCDDTIKCLITNGYDITNEMIKSIVTKEQFEIMEYKVGE